MRRGVIKRIQFDKGYGFIIPDGSQENVFFHVSGVNRDVRPFGALAEGDVVTFDDDAPGEKGPRATNVCAVE